MRLKTDNTEAFIENYAKDAKKQAIARKFLAHLKELAKGVKYGVLDVQDIELIADGYNAMRHDLYEAVDNSKPKKSKPFLNLNDFGHGC